MLKDRGFGEKKATMIVCREIGGNPQKEKVMKIAGALAPFGEKGPQSREVMRFHYENAGNQPWVFRPGGLSYSKPGMDTKRTESGRGKIEKCTCRKGALKADLNRPWHRCGVEKRPDGENPAQGVKKNSVFDHGSEHVRSRQRKSGKLLAPERSCYFDVAEKLPVVKEEKGPPRNVEKYILPSNRNFGDRRS